MLLILRDRPEIPQVLSVFPKEKQLQGPALAVIHMGAAGGRVRRAGAGGGGG